MLTVEVKYIENPKTWTGWETYNAVLGAYHARFSDGHSVWWTHQGVPGTVGAIPLDPAVPEHRAILEDTARRLHDAS